MAKFEGYVSNGLAGCTRKFIVSVPDEELEFADDTDREDIIADYVKTELDQIIEWGWKELKE